MHNPRDDKPIGGEALPEAEAQLQLARLKGALDFAVAQLADMCGGQVIIGIQIPSLKRGELFPAMIMSSKGNTRAFLDLANAIQSSAEGAARAAEGKATDG